jgi:uncharacterized protein (DUF697 family)
MIRAGWCTYVAGIKDLTTVWNNIKEIDLKPIRDSAINPARIVLVGADGSGRHTLAEQIRSDPARPGIYSQATLALLPVEAASGAPVADLIIMLVDATRTDFSKEQALVKQWGESAKSVLVVVNKIDLVGGNLEAETHRGWKASRVIYGSVCDVSWLQGEFIPAVLELLPQQHLALGRQFPLFRVTIARQLISETCFSNAAYSFSTGLAEIVPVLDLPLNLTDMMVLTKTQAFLAYKLGLLLGFSTRWQDYITEFGSVIGTGFLWRQIARELIGLIPAWGIVPKVAVAYSGTYVVGNAILGWYLTGRNLSPRQMRALYTQAFTQGKEYAQKLVGKVPHPRLGRAKKGKIPALKKTLQLETGLSEASVGSSQRAGNESLAADLRPANEPTKQPGEGEVIATIPTQPKGGQIRHPSRRWQVNWPRGGKPASPAFSRTCPSCGKSSSADASFCQYCGVKLDE